jgi:ADP-ribose pyrophosphatase YjhB (NUDIX family)
MEVKNLDIKIQSAFGNLYRKKLALIAARDLEGNILIGSKPNFFPEGISRMLGGGVKDDEDEALGALRELEEELGVEATVEDLKPLLQVNVHAEDQEGKIFENSTYIYFFQLKDNNYKAGDDVKSIIKLSVDELSELGDKYEALTEDNWYEGVEGKHSWGDYGRVYGPIHKFTAQKIKELNL